MWRVAFHARTKIQNKEKKTCATALFRTFRAQPKRERMRLRMRFPVRGFVHAARNRGMLSHRAAFTLAKSWPSRRGEEAGAGGLT